MSLNKQSGNMYSWVTHTWNPLGGECPHKCIYCSTQTLIKRNAVLQEKYTGKPRLIEKELDTKLGCGKKIFVCNMTDLFANYIDANAVINILKHCKKYPENEYLFQSKNPARMLGFLIGIEMLTENITICTTIESNRNTFDGKKISKAPTVDERTVAMFGLKRTGIKAKIAITIEPVLDFDLHEFVRIIKQIEPDFITIGADSKNHCLPEPSKEKLESFICAMRNCTEVKIKKNLRRLQ